MGAEIDGRAVGGLLVCFGQGDDLKKNTEECGLTC